MSIARAREDELDHAAVFHRGPDDLARQVAGPLVAAVERGEAVLASLPPETWHRLERELGDAAGAVQWLHADDRYATPAGAMTALHRFVSDSLDGGAAAVWSLGTLAFSGDPAADEQWIRYEHAVNDVLRGAPLHALCTYDVGTTDPSLLAHAVASHDRRCGAVAPLVGSPPATPPLRAVPIPPGAPLVEVAITEAAAARAAVTVALDEVVAAEVLDDVRLVTSELATNSLRHGRPPSVVRLWREPDAVVVQVTDAGLGIRDPYAELRPARPDGGRGLNIVAQVAQLHFDPRASSAATTARIATAR